MTKVTLTIVGERPDDTEVKKRYLAIAEDRNKAIAKDFDMEPLNVEFKMYHSRGALVSSLGPNRDSMGVFGGYEDHSDSVAIIHPGAVDGLFTDLDKGMYELIDYCLVKFYLCKKYYPEERDFRLYHKYVSEVLAQVVSGKFKANLPKFDIKIFSPDKRFNKEQELAMVFYIMLEKSGIKFIFEQLDQIMKDCDIKKTVFSIYKKSYNELIEQVQREIQKEEKNMKLVRGR